MEKTFFCVAGAPRCGTTALYTYLSEHPNIFMSVVKELHYFADDFKNMQKIDFKSDSEYLKTYAKAGGDHLAIGEASPFYLFSKVAFQKIHAFDSDTRIIISLRNPVDFIHSYHQLNLSLLREDEEDLEKAWELQEARSKGENLPKNLREVELLMYGEIGLFGKKLEKLFSIFPREQVKIVLLDDFVADAKTVYEDILAFLNLPFDNRTVFPKVNANFTNRSQFLAKFFHPSPAVYKLFMKTISLFGANFMKWVSMIYNRIERLNTTKKPRTEMDPKLRARLTAYFSSDIEKLSKLIDRDLSAWTHIPKA